MNCEDAARAMLVVRLIYEEQVWNDARLSWCACNTLGLSCIHDERWGVLDAAEAACAVEKQECAPDTASSSSLSAFSHTAALALTRPCLDQQKVETDARASESLVFPRRSVQF
jgi:hypothetical protein